PGRPRRRSPRSLPGGRVREGILMRLPFVHIERAADAAPARSHPPVVDLVLDDEPGGLVHSIGDLIAPAALSIAADHLVLDGQFARVLALVGLPPEADPGWL